MAACLMWSLVKIPEMEQAVHPTRYLVREVPLIIDTSRPNIHRCWDGGGVLGLELQENVWNGWK
jgi:hypothetical protein